MCISEFKKSLFYYYIYATFNLNYKFVIVLCKKFALLKLKLMIGINQYQNYKLIIILRCEIRFKAYRAIILTIAESYSPLNYLSRYRQVVAVSNDKTIDSSLSISQHPFSYS